MTDKKTQGGADPSEYERTLYLDQEASYPDQEASRSKAEKVGYCSPPKATRFQSGISGNPNGRPKGRKNLKNAFRDILTGTIRVRIDNKVTRMSRLEAVFLTLVNRALTGDLKAFQCVAAIAKAFGLLDDAPIQGLTPEELAELSDEELRKFEKILAKYCEGS